MLRFWFWFCGFILPTIYLISADVIVEEPGDVSRCGHIFLSRGMRAPERDPEEVVLEKVALISSLGKSLSLLQVTDHL